MKNLQLYTIRTTINVTGDEYKELNRIQEQYNISIPIFAIHLLTHIANRLSISKQTGKHSFGAFKTADFLAIKSLSEYRPFEECEKGKLNFYIYSSIDISYDELKVKLANVGILKASRLLLAILRALIKYPDKAAKTTLSGVLIKRRVHPYCTVRYSDISFRMNISLSGEFYDEIKEISKSGGLSMSKLIANALRTLCDVVFNNGRHVENEKLLREYVLNYAGTTPIGRYGTKPLIVTIQDIKYSVQILAIMEKYGIPGKAELMSRVVRFIIAGHRGIVSLNQIHIDDDSDYNETKMVRNAYRKEVSYGAH